MDGYRGLHIGRRGKGLGMLDRYRGIARNQRGGDATQGFNPEGQRRDIDQHDITDFPAEYAGLDRSTAGDALHRIDAHFSLASKQALKIFSHHRHARRSTDEYDPVDVLAADTGIVQCLLNRATATLHHIMDLTLEFGPCQVHFQMFGFAGDCRQIGQTNMRGRAGRQFDFCNLGRFLQACDSFFITTDIDADLLLVFVGDIVDQVLVHIGASELGIAAGRLDLEHAFAEFHDGHVQRTATEIDHRDAQLLTSTIEPVGQRCRGRFVDQTSDLDPGNTTRIFGRTALVIIKVGRHRYHGLGHRLTEEGLCICFDFLQQKS